MAEGEAVWDCASELLLRLSRSVLVQGELLQVYPGLLALSSVCGVVTGLLTAALLLRFCVRPAILTRQGYNIRRLLEPEEAELENSPSDGVSSAKNEGPGASNKDHSEKKPPPVSGDVAAFATRAKVVYPINQKYRPLADGASNPSLHEASRVPPLSADAPSSSSSCCCSDEDSDEEDEDDEGQNGGGHFVSSVLPQSLQNHSFTAVSHRALTLTLTGEESRMNLYFLALRDVQQNYVQLQEEKDLMYSQIMKTLFGDRFPKNKEESDFCQTILQTQEKELREMKKQFPFSSSAPEESEGAVVTLEEIERSQKELLEHGLHACESFSKQVEDLSQLLLRNTSVFHPEEAQEIISSIAKNLLLLENHLQSSQDSLLSKVHEKVVWWAELRALMQMQPVWLRRESSLRQSLISTALEQMTSDGVLTFSQMETILSEIQETQSDVLKQHNQDCVKKTADLVTEKTNRLESKRRKMLKNHSKERRVLEQPQRDLQGALKVHQELALRHRQQLKDLDSQQELRLKEALTELWTSLRSSWSSRLTDQCRSLLLSSLSPESGLTQDQAGSGSGLTQDQGGSGSGLTQDQGGSGSGLTQDQPGYGSGLAQDQAGSGSGLTQDQGGSGSGLTQDQGGSGSGLTQDQAGSGSGLAQDQAEGLWSDLEKALGPQLCEAESSVREQLHREGQTWREEMVLAEVCLKHLSEHQTQSLQALELRQSYTLNNQAGRLLSLKHLHLLGALRRLFMVRHVSLNLLKEMRLSKLSALSESDCRPAPSSEKSQDTVTVERRLAEEGRLLELSSKQEFLSELESGAELLQRHLQTIVGNALSHSIQQEMEREPSELSSDLQDDNMKSRLIEAASESVYLTKDSLTALVQKYYSQLQSITEQLQQEPARLSDDEEEAESSAQIMKSLLRELQNWSRKPGSAEFTQRVEQHKLRLLLQTDREQNRLWEELRHRKITRDITLDKVKDQLMGAEERFMEELAALARVSLPKEETESRDEQEDNICDSMVNVRELLALNPALDPALNPSLTPLISAPVKVVFREQQKKTT